MRSSTGSMSQARNAVLAAAMPMQTKANAIQLAYRQMKSRTSRRTRASELNACAEIPDLSCMGPAASVRGGRRGLQGWGHPVLASGARGGEVVDGPRRGNGAGAGI